MKSVFVGSYSLDRQEHIVDGRRLAYDIQEVLNDLDRDGYDVISMIPIVGGRYDIRPFDGRTQGLLNQKTTSPDTCASFGYSMTDGVIIAARRRVSR